MIQGITEINLPSYATLSSATIVDNEMGDKTIEATVAIDASVVPDFSFNWELEFKGERYIQPLREPQGNKSSESIKAHMNLTFYHKVAYQLKRYFFFETASVGAGTVIADKYEASVYLDLGEFVTMFNEVLNYYFGDDIVMDLNPNWEYSSEKVFIEISSSYIWDVLQKINELYGVRWRISGDTIYVGYADVELSHVFEYGFSGGLMKLERQVQDPSIKNQLLGRGGSKNLPQYYFKTAPEGSGFTSDPDACPELQYIYFDELRGKTFRDYVKGWNAKHYGGDPMDDPTVAYTKGYTDEVFSPIEYVEDPVSIARYGVLQGILDSNEDIFPSIKGRTVSPYGRIDEIIDAEEPDKDNYDQDENAYNDSKATILSTLRQSVNVAAHGTGQIALPRSEVFTVPEGKIGTIESWIGQWSGYYYLNGEQKDAKGLLDYDVTDTSFVVYNATTGNVVSGANLPAGSYYFVASGEVSNISNYQIYATFEIANVRLVTAAPGDQGWKYTFDIWVKNIWQSTQQSGESDEDYAHRVWSPILGSHGEEARVLFDSGWLYGHEDWEFPIISVHKDQSKTRGGIRSEWRLTLKKSDAEIEATGKYIPSSEETVQAHAGDYFHFIGIDMPFVYVEMAEADLDEYKTQQLAQYSDIKPTWVVTMDHVRLQTKLGTESQTFYQQLQSGAMIYIRNNQFTDSASIAFYLESITYTWSSDTVIIPNVEVVLSDKVKTVYSPVSLMQSDIRALNSQVGSLKEAAVRASVASASMYLPKDGTPARSLSETTFAKTVTGSEFREGQLGGVDWGIYRDENGKAIIEADKVVVREQLVVNDLVVNQITYQGGMQIISAASMECIRVDDTTDGYVCYFDQKQGSVANLFKVGDVAYSHIFDESDLSLKYYKRKVEAVGSNYITLSKTVYDGTGIPMAGDNIIQYGSYTDATRRFVIIRDVIGGGYERMLSGLDSVTATGKEYYYAGKQNGGERWFVGDKGTDGQYAEYVNGQLNLKAIVNFLPQSTGLEQLEAYQKLVQIAQGNIETWFHDGVSPAQTGAPTMSNYPVNTWESEDYESHVGDIYYSNTGKGYRFKKSGSTYAWEVISDSELAEAMAKVQALQYLKTATNEGTLIAGGLVLTSLLQLGYTDTSDIYHVMSGLNGIGSDQRGIAAWFGGPMVDHELSPSATDYAKSLLRFDGTGYLAKGNITWDTNGYGQVGGSGNNYAVKWDANGVTLGSGIKLGASDETLASLLAIIQKLGSMFTVVEYETGKYALKVNTSAMDAGGVSRTIDGLYTEGFLSGNGASSENGGGGASLLRELLDVFGNSTSVLRADGTAAQNGDVFVYNTSKHKWVAISQSSIVPSIDLSEYLKKTEASSTYQTIIDATHKLAASLISGLAAVATSGSYDDLDDAPSTLPNPNALTFGSDSYDGSEAKTITKSSIGLGNVENTKLSNWTGSTYINTVGTINTGTWNGTAIARNKLDSSTQASLDKADSAYQKPSGGITASELASAVQTILDHAEEAYDLRHSHSNKTVLDKLTQNDIDNVRSLISWFGYDQEKNMVYVRNQGGSGNTGLFAYGALSGNGASINSEGGGGGGGDLPHVFLTEAEYEALGIKDPNTLYFTYEE